ncbi:hypothetical protein [Pseudomonas prosekii]|uniref:hypothetical protein n=1 Tax=Pseudomonas prosekii TaxID=1148509 RepID=UPI000B855D4D|nr:hypothetical protein [Pseudomonas prosekii]
MKNVCFQGTALSPGQRRQLVFQQKVRAAFSNPVLNQQVSQTIEFLEARKEQGVKPQQIWFFDTQEIGTISIAEWMGF